MKVYLRAGLRIAVATTLFFAIAAFARSPAAPPPPGPVPPALSAALTVFVSNAEADSGPCRLSAGSARGIEHKPPVTPNTGL